MYFSNSSFCLSFRVVELIDIPTLALTIIANAARKYNFFISKEFYLINTNGLIRKNVCQIDIAFPIVHGTNVEDGALQGYLQTIGIPYVGPNVYASAVGQDKVFMKQIWENEKIPMSKFIWFYDNDYILSKENPKD